MNTNIIPQAVNKVLQSAPASSQLLAFNLLSILWLKNVPVL